VKYLQRQLSHEHQKGKGKKEDQEQHEGNDKDKVFWDSHNLQMTINYLPTKKFWIRGLIFIDNN